MSTQDQLNEAMAFIESLKAAGTIPYEVDKAFRARLATLTGLSTSGKSATSEGHSVNEAGASSYSVLNNPDLFLQVSISGTTYYIPAFT